MVSIDPNPGERFYVRRLSQLRRVTCLVLTTFLGLGSGLSLARRGNKHESPYREWLDRDVAYIITKEEREAFLKLTTDHDRDSFIERFWQVRSPTPGAPTNPYKD